MKIILKNLMFVFLLLVITSFLSIKAEAVKNTSNEVMLILSNEATFKMKTYEINDFNVSNNFNILSIEEIDNDIYEMIKRRLNNQEVPKEIMDIDLYQYHRKLLLKVSTPINLFFPQIFIENEDILYAVPGSEIEYIEVSNFLENRPNYLDFLYIEINDKIIKDNYNIIDCFVIKSFNDEIKEKTDLTQIKIIIPSFLFDFIEINDRFIYQLNKRIEIDDEIIYDARADISTLIPVYYGFITLPDFKCNEQFIDWFDSASNFYNNLTKSFYMSNDFDMFNVSFNIINAPVEMLGELVKRYEKIKQSKMVPIVGYYSLDRFNAVEAINSKR